MGQNLWAQKTPFSATPNIENYTQTISSKAIFDSLKGSPLSSHYSGVSAVKVVYKLSDSSIYYISSNRFKYHFEFCEKTLHYKHDLNHFNATNYTNGNEKEYILATINYFSDAEKYVLEFVSEDRSSANQYQTIYNKIKETTFFGNQLLIYSNNEYIQNLLANQKLVAPSIFSDQLYEKINYQIIHPGKAIGRLKFIANKKQLALISPSDILLLSISPNEIPLCKAIVTTQFQTPLSHISLLCQNRKTPSASIKNGFDLPAFKSLENKIVCLDLTTSDYKIREAKEGEIDTLHFQKKQISLHGDTRFNSIETLEKLPNNCEKFCGAKVANLKILAAISQANKGSFSTPEGAFAIPFYFYQQHIRQPKIQSLLKKLLEDSTIYKDPTLLKIQLKKIRQEIKNTPLDKELIEKVNAQLNAFPQYKSFRFRSSTNAEDLARFNGAGLYESKSFVRNDSVKTVERAIKEVWASAWNERAYLERKFFNIQQNSVLMGILAHRGFPNEEANGVAITRNLYRNDFVGYTVNVQIGEESVVSPNENITCDQLICFESNDVGLKENKVVAEYITYSNINKKRGVLNEPQITQLYHALEKIHTHFIYPTNVENTLYNRALDVEFKFEKGLLYIKQVRYFDAN